MTATAARLRLTAADLATVCTAAVAELRSVGGAGVLHGDAFVECRSTVAGRLEGHQIVRGSHVVERGVGLRAVRRDGVFYAAVDDLSEPGIRLAGHRLRSALGSSGDRVISPAGGRSARDDHFVDGDQQDLGRFLELVDAAASTFDSRITQVVIDVQRSRQDIAVQPLDGPVRVDTRTSLYLTIRAIARSAGGFTVGFFTPGVSADLDALDPVAIGVEAGRRAIGMIGARPAPVGEFPVIIGPGRGAVLIHEACCHPLEADEVGRGSVYLGRIGERVASPLLTIVDDPTIPGLVGTYRIDDEGTAAQPTTLIENGILRRYLSDRTRAWRTTAPASGNSRRQSYRHPPIPRMSNTCVLSGDARPSEAFDVPGVAFYAEHVSGGQVDPATGQFVFHVTNGHLVRDGVVAEPVGETTLSGDGPQVLLDIDFVADDVAAGAARCGKAGQWVQVGLRQPTLRVRRLLVGGTAA